MRDEMNRSNSSSTGRIVVLTIMLAVGLASTATADVCRFEVLPTAINFGTYTAGSTSPLDVPVTFQVFCNPGTAGSARISAGGSGSFNPRKMSSGGNLLNYNLFTQASAAPTTIWGDGTSGTTFSTFNHTSSTKTTTYTIYARIPAGLDVASGTYTDSVDIRLYYGNTYASEMVTVPVSATVVGQCTIESFNLSFGSYNPITTAAHDATTVIRAFCNAGMVASISLDNGAHFSGGLRRMAGPVGEYLSYNIFADAGRTVVWNSSSTVSSTSTSFTTPLGGINGLTGYGRIPPQQAVRAGAYTDTVIATVNY